jgi:hypothetical protein
MKWMQVARDALAALVARRHLSDTEHQRVEQLAEEDATSGTVYAINVGYGAAAARHDDPARLSLGDDWWPQA